jgi:ATP-dependent DNA helicase RecQ
LLQPKVKVEKTRFDSDSWAGVDPGLFESLRNLRRDIAHERSLPAYVLLSDATLRDMARLRPRSPAALLRVRGVGERKLSDFGQRFLERIAIYCRENELPRDINVTASTPRDRARLR